MALQPMLMSKGSSIGLNPQKSTFSLPNLPPSRFEFFSTCRRRGQGWLMVSTPLGSQMPKLLGIPQPCS
jgi:hypothetical protein